MTDATDSAKLEYLCREVGSIKEDVKILQSMSAHMERQKLQDEHFKANQEKTDEHINRLYNKLETHEKEDRESFTRLSDQLQTLDARPGRVALHWLERVGIGLLLLIIVGLFGSWLQMQKMEIQARITPQQRTP